MAARHDQEILSDFQLLQNFRSAALKIHYYAFDLLFHKGKLLTHLPLEERRALLNEVVPVQEFVVGGYTPGNPFDALIVGFHRGKDLVYAAKVRAGFVPATRREVFSHIKGLETSKCPFVNLPEKGEGRWGQGLTAEKMKQCIWVRPNVVVRIDFLEWTGADHLRHTKFVALRDDKDPRKVVGEMS